MTKVHNAHRLGTINSGGPRYGASRCRTNCHISTMPAARPARIQIIQAGQNEPSMLRIGSQAVKKTAKKAGKLNLINFRNNILFILGSFFGIRIPLLPIPSKHSYFIAY